MGYKAGRVDLEGKGSECDVSVMVHRTNSQIINKKKIMLEKNTSPCGTLVDHGLILRTEFPSHQEEGRQLKSLGNTLGCSWRATKMVHVTDRVLQLEPTLP